MDRTPSPVRRPSGVRRHSPGRRSLLDRSASPSRLASPDRRSSSFKPSSPPAALEEVSEEDSPKDAGVSDYKRLASVLIQEFGDSLCHAAPPSPGSLWDSTKSTRPSSFVKMRPTISMRKAFKGVGEWMQSKKDASKTVFSFPPLKLLGKSGMWYETKEPMGLGLPTSADADFSNLVDSSRRLSLSSAKATWGMSEMDHLLKGFFRVVEVFNFMDWSLGALANRTRDPEFLCMDDFVSVLSCLDKAVRDGSAEVAALFGAAILKKRSVFSSFLTKSVSPLQRSSLLFAPFSPHLFPQNLVKEISRSLSEKATQDLLAQSSKRVRPAVPFAKKEKAPFQEPFRGGPSSRPSFRSKRPERRGRSSSRSIRRTK